MIPLALQLKADDFRNFGVVIMDKVNALLYHGFNSS